MDIPNKESIYPKRFVAIIPARFASTRFPGKPLVEIGGKTMIQRVYEQVSNAVENVYVATDDVRIQEACIGFGAQVIMTSELHRSGTDRCYEAYTKIGEEFDVIINVQGHSNTLEWLPIFLPSMWLFAIYWSPAWAAGLGALWLVGRIAYCVGYLAEPMKRYPGFFIQAVAAFALLFGTLGRILYMMSG